MGTTLTGTTPQDTYDSLIKVTDNGPLSGTAKYLSDGLGNDSALALSTSAVGVGTSSLFAELQVNKASDVTLALSNSSAVTSGNRGSLSFYNSAVSTVALIKATAVTDNVGTQLEFYTRPAAGSLAQTMTITSTGNVGIGTSSPSKKLHVAGTGLFVSSTASLNGSNGLNIAKGDASYHNGIFFEGASLTDVYFGRVAGASDDIVWKRAVNGAEIARIQMNNGGISFNGDTAAANALDDYEEGTFTATLKGGVTDPTTPVTTTGIYTKIGRQVQVNIFFDNVDTTGASGDVFVSGLPFTSSATTMRYTGSVISFNFTFGGTAIGTFMGTGSTQFEILSSVTNGAWSNMTHATTGAARYLTIAHTYFV